MKKKIGKKFPVQLKFLKVDKVKSLIYPGDYQKTQKLISIPPCFKHLRVFISLFILASCKKDSLSKTVG